LPFYRKAVLRNVDNFFQIYCTKSYKDMKNNQEFITLNGWGKLSLTIIIPLIIGGMPCSH
jgi:hypothetical protein